MTTLEQHEKDAADLAVAQATIATLTKDRDVNAAAIAKAQATIAGHVATIATHAGEIVTLKASVTDITDKHAAEVKAHEDTRDKLGLARQALANPSFAAAARQGLGIDRATKEGSPAAEPKASGEPTTKEEAAEQYNRMLDDKGVGAKALADYRGKYKELLGIK